MEISDVSHLAGLGDPIPLLLEPPLRIELQGLLHIVIKISKKQETHNDCPCPPFPMITVDDHNILLILCMDDDVR